MIARISKRISSNLLKSNAINQDELNVYAYGIHLLVLSIIDWSITFLLMLLMGEIYLSIAYLVVFFALRIHCGGYHAESHIRCIMISNIVYVISVLTSANMPCRNFQILFLIGELINLWLLYFFSPVEHPNKQITPSELKRHKKLGKIINVVATMFAIGFMLRDMKQYACVILMAQLSVSIAVVLQRIKNRMREEESE